MFRSRLSRALAVVCISSGLLFGATTSAQAQSPSVETGTQVPMDLLFSLDRPYTMAKGNWPRANSVRLFNSDTEPATVTVTDEAGQIVLTKQTGPEGQIFLNLPKPTQLFTPYNVNITAADGRSMTLPVAVLNIGGNSLHGAMFEPCSTLTWAYDKAGAPSNARKLTRDINRSLRAITEETGLTFTPAANPNNADIVFTWGNAKGNVAFAYTTGEINLSTKARQLRDPNAGFGRGGRAWILAHEILHILGLQHTDEASSVMHPHVYTQAAFSATDKALLKALYGMHPCPA